MDHYDRDDQPSQQESVKEYSHHSQLSKQIVHLLCGVDLMGKFLVVSLSILGLFGVQAGGQALEAGVQPSGEQLQERVPVRVRVVFETTVVVPVFGSRIRPNT